MSVARDQHATLGLFNEQRRHLALQRLSDQFTSCVAGHWTDGPPTQRRWVHVRAPSHLYSGQRTEVSSLVKSASSAKPVLNEVQLSHIQLYSGHVIYSCVVNCFYRRFTYRWSLHTLTIIKNIRIQRPVYQCVVPFDANVDSGVLPLLLFSFISRSLAMPLYVAPINLGTFFSQTVLSGILFRQPSFVCLSVCVFQW